MYRLRHWSRFVVLALVLAATPARAQQTGNIDGRVTDDTGAILPGVTVTLTSPVLLTPQTRATDQGGRYVFANLVPGTYALAFDSRAFRALERSSYPSARRLPSTWSLA
jgi:hypothetical protein